jgi:hypothetical protein
MSKIPEGDLPHSLTQSAGNLANLPPAKCLGTPSYCPLHSKAKAPRLRNDLDPKNDEKAHGLGGCEG